MTNLLQRSVTYLRFATKVVLVTARRVKSGMQPVAAKTNYFRKLMTAKPPLVQCSIKEARMLELPGMSA